MFVCVLVFVFVHEWVECTKGIVEQDRDLAGMGGVGGDLSVRPAALLSCVHPAVRIMFGTLAQALRHPRPAERRKKILTHLNTESGRKEQLKGN